MISVLLISLTVLAVLIATIAWIVGVTSTVAAIRVEATELLSVGGVSGDRKAKKEAAKRRMIKAMITFVIAIACVAMITWLRMILNER